MKGKVDSTFIPSKLSQIIWLHDIIKLVAFCTYFNYHLIYINPLRNKFPLDVSCVSVTIKANKRGFQKQLNAICTSIDFPYLSAAIVLDHSRKYKYENKPWSCKTKYLMTQYSPVCQYSHIFSLSFCINTLRKEVPVNLMHLVQLETWTY